MSICPGRTGKYQALGSDIQKAGDLMTWTSVKPRCRRCHRPYTPTKGDQGFGPKCARKQLNTNIEVRNTEGEIVAVIV
jgi:hypothetical protein